jgi:hypothetical protein
MRARILRSNALPVLVFPYRCRLIILQLARICKKSILWQFRRTEFVKFTRDLTQVNRDYLTCCLTDALLNNVSSRLTTNDLEPSSELLISTKNSGVTEHVIDDLLSAISNIDQIDLFIHDSDHSAERGACEFELLSSRLSYRGIFLSDNCQVTTDLAKWGFRHSRRFIHFAEQTLNHWYPGSGIGVSMRGL